MSLRHEGTGKTTFQDGSEVEGAFTILVELNGKAYLQLTTESELSPHVFSLPHEKILFHGEEIGTRGLVDIQKMYLTQIHISGVNSLTYKIFHPFEINYQKINEHDKIILFRYLSNFIFYGDEVSIYERERRLDKISISLEGKKITIKQISNFKEVEDYFKREKNPRVTCSLEIEGENREIELLRELANDVENIISFGSCNYVTVLKEEIFLKDKLCKTIFYPLKTYPFNSGTSLINTNVHDIGRLKNFIITAYPHYKAKKRDLALPYVIEFFNSAKIYNILQTSFLMSCVALECLYHHYHQLKGLPKTENLAKKIEQICTDVGVSYDQNDLDLRNLRNSLAHEGDFPKGINSYQEKNRLEYLLDRMILTILEYRGNIYYNVFKNAEDTL
jgi:hypothetical protein